MLNARRKPGKISETKKLERHSVLVGKIGNAYAFDFSHDLIELLKEIPSNANKKQLWEFHFRLFVELENMLARKVLDWCE